MPPARQSKQIMKKNVPVKKQPVEAQAQPPNIQRRINAGWLRLWRAVWPNIAPPRKVQGSGFKVRGSKFSPHASDEQRPAAVDHLATFLAAWLALVLLATGCATRPLKGGKAVTTHSPVGAIEQTIVQGENPSQAACNRVGHASRLPSFPRLRAGGRNALGGRRDACPTLANTFGARSIVGLGGHACRNKQTKKESK